VLALLALAASCAKANPHTVADATNQAIASALFALDDYERAEFTAGRISPAAHRDFSVKLLPALKTGRALNQILSVWQPGTPLPSDVVTLVSTAGTLSQIVLTALPDGPTKTQLLLYTNALQSAVNAFLLALAGGEA
jgi:hypothetical protein